MWKDVLKQLIKDDLAVKFYEKKSDKYFERNPYVVQYIKGGFTNGQDLHP